MFKFQSLNKQTQKQQKAKKIKRLNSKKKSRIAEAEHNGLSLSKITESVEKDKIQEETKHEEKNDARLEIMCKELILGAKTFLDSDTKMQIKFFFLNINKVQIMMSTQPPNSQRLRLSCTFENIKRLFVHVQDQKFAIIRFQVAKNNLKIDAPKKDNIGEQTIYVPAPAQDIKHLELQGREEVTIQVKIAKLANLNLIEQLTSRNDRLKILLDTSLDWQKFFTQERQEDKKEDEIKENKKNKTESAPKKSQKPSKKRKREQIEKKEDNEKKSKKVSKKRKISKDQDLKSKKKLKKSK